MNRRSFIACLAAIIPAKMIKPDGLEPLKELQANVNIIERDYDRAIEEVYDDMQHDVDLAKENSLVFYEREESLAKLKNWTCPQNW